MNFTEFGWDGADEYNEYSEQLVNKLNIILKEDTDKGMSLIQKADELLPTKENVVGLIEEINSNY
jgi:hypothetical protein